MDEHSSHRDDFIEYASVSSITKGAGGDFPGALRYEKERWIYALCDRGHTLLFLYAKAGSGNCEGLWKRSCD